MDDSLWISNLRDILASLYPTATDARRIVVDVGLNPAFIAFDNKAVNSWSSILQEAKTRGKVKEIVLAAYKEYPENEWLALASTTSLPSVRGVDVHSSIKWKGSEDTSSLEKIIGTQSTLLHVRFLEIGTHRARSVVRVIRDDGAVGSGFLVQDNLLITNHHVLDSAERATGAEIQFNYQLTRTGLEAPSETYKLDPGEVFATSVEDDWTAVRVAGNANVKWGALKLSKAQTKAGDRVTIVQHPGGGPKQIALHNNVVVFANDQIVQYLTDTLPGSSGSPVFGSSWNLVALHHSGGWLREPGSRLVHYRNEGIHINKVIDGMQRANVL